MRLRGRRARLPAPVGQAPVRRASVRRAPVRPATVLLTTVLLACTGCGAAAAPQAKTTGNGPDPGLSRLPASGPVGASPAPGTSTATASPVASTAPAALPLAGKIIGIDPGHDGGNFADPGYINQLIWNGMEQETCDTTGTQTASGYTEAQFNFSVATDLRADLIKAGARVVMTRHSNAGVGPCVTRRAQILNNARVSVAIDIHADGGPSWGRGFTVLEPVADGPNNNVIKDSTRFGADVRAALLKHTSMPESDYYGHNGLISRDDLAGLNLTTVPKVLIECGNMPNATDAALLATPSFQRQLASAFTAAIIEYLSS
jgi:N-acetylmuramoyl-L-alanine amidase